MEPLITLVTVTLLLACAGALGVRWLRPWPVPLRGGLAAMFVLTGVVHFVFLREELVAMVPPQLPAPGLLVTVTGVLELAGAAGLLWRRTAPWAAGGLTLLLIAMFPANVYADIDGQSALASDSLLARTLLQVLFVAATLAVVVAHLRERKRGSRAGADAGLSGGAPRHPSRA